jgi:hypothetical protein
MVQGREHTGAMTVGSEEAARTSGAATASGVATSVVVSLGSSAATTGARVGTSATAAG